MVTEYYYCKFGNGKWKILF